MFKRKSDMNIHIRDTHSNTASYQCDYPGCSNSYKHRTSLQRHIREVHGSSTYQCPIPGCHKTFTWKTSLSYHLKYSHNFDESQRLPCPYPECDQSFKHPKYLRNHIRYMHNDVPRLKCSYHDCNRSYQRRRGLNQHIRFVHLDVRPHVCKICGKRYRQLDLLKYHLEHDLCGSNLGELHVKYTKQHHKAVNHWENFLRETKNPQSIYTEATLPNGRRLDLLVYCADDRVIGFDVTIGRSTTKNLSAAITEKYDRNYEQFCDIIYIFVISKVKNTLKTIQECNRNPTKPKEVRVVHWRAIVRDSSKYIKIFQQIEDESVL